MPQLMVYCAIFSLGWLGSWWYFSADIDPIEQGIGRPLSTSPASDVKTLTSRSFQPGALTKSPRHSRSVSNLSKFDHAKSLLTRHQYAQFVQLYTSLRSTVDEAVLERYQRLLLNTVKKLQQQKSYQQALHLLTLFLEYEYDNSDALILFAELQHSQKNYLASLDTLFRARSYLHQTDAIAALNQKLRALIAEQRAGLSKPENQLALLDFYRRLTELEPDYALNFIGLAEVYLSLGNREDAGIALAMVSHDPSVSDQVERVYASINQAPALELSGATPITLISVRDQFLIEVMINNQLPARLLLDTGASLSIISPEILDALGLSSLRPTKTGWFNTANGVVSAAIYNMQSLSVDNYQLKSIDVGVLEVSSSGDIDGLLGMNFLKHFKFYIDQKNKLLYLQ